MDNAPSHNIRIGTTFTLGDAKWRCTDVGTRTVIAIRIDRLEVGGTGPRMFISEKEATDRGWFDGPPYAVAETVFDEDQIEDCVSLEQPAP